MMRSFAGVNGRVQRAALAGQQGTVFEVRSAKRSMNGKSVTAWVFVAMMLLMLRSMPQPTVLKDEAVVHHVAMSSDMVVNFSYTVSGGAEVVDMAYAHDHYYVALAHSGVGIIGNYTWLGTTPRRLVGQNRSQRHGDGNGACTVPAAEVGGLGRLCGDDRRPPVHGSVS